MLVHDIVDKPLLLDLCNNESVPVHVMKEYRGNRDVAPPIHNLGAG
jgi:hypothetical protein